MWSLKRPSEVEIIEYLLRCNEEQAFDEGFGAPSGCAPVQFREPLGRGPSLYRRCREAHRNWRAFPSEPFELCWPDRTLAAGVGFGLLFRQGPLWRLEPARILRLIDESNGSLKPSRSGFVWGMLPGGLIRGRQQLVVEWSPSDDQVSFEATSTARPARVSPWPTSASWRRAFRRFAKAAAQSLRDAAPDELDATRPNQTAPVGGAA